MLPHPTQTAAWADFDNDGWLDLFVGEESSPEEPNPSQLFHNNHDGTFTEMAAPMGLAQMGFVKGVAWGDFNNDGRPDLYISELNGHNRLFRNDGPATPGNSSGAFWKFTDVTESAGVATQTHSFATWFFDYDNDGWPDIFSAGYSTVLAQDVGAFEMGKPYKAATPRLYHNNHDGTFTDVTKDVHLDRAILTMGANFGDLDNDGFLDIYLGTGDSSYQALLPNRHIRRLRPSAKGPRHRLWRPGKHRQRRRLRRDGRSATRRYLSKRPLPQPGPRQSLDHARARGCPDQSRGLRSADRSRHQ